MGGESFSQRCTWFLSSLVIPCVSLFLRKQLVLGIHTLLIGGGVILLTLLIGYFAGFGAGLFSGMLLIFRWWVFQAFRGVWTDLNGFSHFPHYSLPLISFSAEPALHLILPS